MTAAPGRQKAPSWYGADRAAGPGERCICGRLAVGVINDPELGEIGYCGRPGVPPLVPCVFCGADRHEGGARRCPDYRLAGDDPGPGAGRGDLLAGPAGVDVEADPNGAGREGR